MLSVTNAEPHGPVQAITRFGDVDWPLAAPVTADVFGEATIVVEGAPGIELDDLRVEAANGSSRDD